MWIDHLPISAYNSHSASLDAMSHGKCCYSAAEEATFSALMALKSFHKEQEFYSSSKVCNTSASGVQLSSPRDPLTISMLQSDELHYER